MDGNIDRVVMVSTVLRIRRLVCYLGRIDREEGKPTKVNCFSRSSDMAAAWDAVEGMAKAAVWRSWLGTKEAKRGQQDKPDGADNPDKGD